MGLRLHSWGWGWGLRCRRAQGRPAILTSKNLCWVLASSSLRPHRTFSEHQWWSGLGLSGALCGRCKDPSFPVWQGRLLPSPPWAGLLRPHWANGCPRPGYLLPRTIVALQKTWQQSLSQFLSYLNAHDQLQRQAMRRARWRRLWRCSNSLRTRQGSSYAWEVQWHWIPAGPGQGGAAGSCQPLPASPRGAGGLLPVTTGAGCNAWAHQACAKPSSPF